MRCGSLWPAEMTDDRRGQAADGHAHRTAAAAGARRGAAVAQAEAEAPGCGQAGPTGAGCSAGRPGRRRTARRDRTDHRRAGPTESPAALVEATPLVPPAPPTPDKTLPPRVDLAYKVFFGTHGFLIGDARIASSTTAIAIGSPRSAKARGLAALFCAARARSKAAASSRRTACSRRSSPSSAAARDRRETARLRLGGRHRHAARRQRPRRSTCRRSIRWR